MNIEKLISQKWFKIAFALFIFLFLIEFNFSGVLSTISGLFYMFSIFSILQGTSIFSQGLNILTQGYSLTCTATPYSLAGIVSLSFFGVLISLFVLLFIYFFAVLFASDLLKQTIKKEMQNLAVSVVIALLFVPMYLSINGFIDQEKYDFFGTGDSRTIHEEAFLFARDNFQKLSTWFIAVQWLSAWISVYTRAPVSIRPAGLIGFDLNLNEAAKHVSSFLQNINKLAFAGMGLWSVIMFILCFLRVEFLSVLFPFGIFFRSFTPTKGFGSILIAISLTFYIFFPFLVFVDKIFYTMLFSQKRYFSDATDLEQNLELTMPKDLDKNHVGTSPSFSFFRRVFGFLHNLLTRTGERARFFMISTKILLKNMIFGVLFLGFFVQILNIYLLFIITGTIARVLDTRVDLSAIEKLL